MGKVFIVLISAIIVYGCNQKKQSPKKYTDLFLYNLKGDIQTIEDSTYKIDSSGKLKPDSIAFEKGEYKDGYVVKYTDVDSIGNVSSESFYSHFSNGLWRGYKQVQKGKTSFSTEFQVDSSGKYVSGQQYDSTGKLQFYYAKLKQNEYGWLTEGKLCKPDSTLKFSFISNYEKQVYTGGSYYDSSGKETYRSTIKLNDKGDPIEETDISTYKYSTTKKDSSTTTIKKYRYDSYDATGNWTQMTELDKNNKPVKITKRRITYAKSD